MTDAALRDTIIRRALDRRPPGRPVDAVAPCTSLDAFRSAAAQLHGVLRAVGPDDWDAHAHDQIGTVRDVVAHLVGVERVVLGWLAAPAGAKPVPTEHLSATVAVIGDLATVADDDLPALWFDVAERVLSACAAADPTTPILAHDLPTDVDGLLLLRSFELWAHLQDVCAATGRPVPPIDDSRMALMSSRLMGALPIALALRDTVVSSHVRFVLTGPAGGCFDVELEPGGTGDVAVTIVADTIDVCRVAARRLPARELDVTVEGDADDAFAVLAALDAFARD